MDKTSNNYQAPPIANVLLGAVNEGLEWYKTLTLEQKMGLKECAHLLCGMRWEEFTILFTPRQRVEILHQKLKLEGFAV